ncbi:acidic leucine-rich nuclear phosphoprotein 32 family member E-like [Rhodnius prolixus]|uniref:U2A'/phosphoprotein 32 family A C-terminal domain-containing protein n=1 Tax=Rhodnius prolixus TaxID=13249 RepID=T1I9L3_RHOPR
MTSVKFDPRTIEGIKESLKELSCCSNYLQDLDELAGLHKLEVLDLKHNEIKNLTETLNVLQNFPNLTYLNLKDNRVREAKEYKKRLLGSQHFNIETLDEIRIPAELRRHYIRITETTRPDSVAEAVREEFESLPRGLREEVEIGFLYLVGLKSKQNL